MKDGNFSEFLDHLYYGDELYLKYKDCIYFIQGWVHDIEGARSPKIMECYRSCNGSYDEIFHTEKNSMYECAQQFLQEKIFEEKTLQEIEKDATWVDGLK